MTKFTGPFRKLAKIASQAKRSADRSHDFNDEMIDRSEEMVVSSRELLRKGAKHLTPPQSAENSAS